jgi:hypothetical protein
MLQVADWMAFTADVRNNFSGHGTVRDDLEDKRRLHCFLFKCKPGADGAGRVPVVMYKEHDRFEPFQSSWRNDGSYMEVFKDIKNLKSTLAGRTLTETAPVRIDWTLVEKKVNAVVKQLKKTRASIVRKSAAAATATATATATVTAASESAAAATATATVTATVTAASDSDASAGVSASDSELEPEPVPEPVPKWDEIPPPPPELSGMVLSITETPDWWQSFFSACDARWPRESLTTTASKPPAATASKPPAATACKPPAAPFPLPLLEGDPRPVPDLARQIIQVGDKGGPLRI